MTALFIGCLNSHVESTSIIEVELFSFFSYFSVFAHSLLVRDVSMKLDCLPHFGGSISRYRNDSNTEKNMILVILVRKKTPYMMTLENEFLYCLYHRPTEYVLKHLLSVIKFEAVQHMLM